MGRAGVYFLFLSVEQPSLFMRLPASVKLSNRYLLLVVGGSGT